MKEIIVREGFLPRQPWQAKRRTIGRVAGQRGTNVLCATFLSFARIKAIFFSGDFCNKDEPADTFDAVLGEKIRENI